MTTRPIPERREVKRALRELGMSNRQIKALLHDGWKHLVGETEAENQELKEQLREFPERLR